MQTITLKKLPRPRVVRRRPACPAILSKALGIALLFALFHLAVPAMGALPANPYVASVNWDRNPAPAVSGYRIYYGTTSGNYTASNLLGNVTGTTVAGLAAGVTYFFAVTACDTNGLEGAFSAEVSFVPGRPAVQLSPAPNHQSVLTVAGLIGQAYEIQATQDFKTWQVIGNVTTGATGTASFIDLNAFLFSYRYYRTRATP
ncbi:MAG TPA: fibronectin type III domain-containing protein [Candidatus Acidoferrales bacterium]|jgi:hypothetical protein|nr:fibronectin type III domain-containing protein [Candidatus Acidoferrales bacterium]